MGEPAQKRIIRKLDLERFLSQIAPHPSPKASLEQYTLSAAVAAKMLYIAAYTNDDIIGKTVVDLGCGTGRLALTASYMGARCVVGVDVEKAAIKAAYETSKSVGLSSTVHWVVGDIDAITGRFDTVLQNPPFGVQRRGADRKFLEKALEVGNAIYSLHNHPETDKRLIKKLKANGGGLVRVPPSPFIKRFVEDHNGAVKAVYAVLMTIPRMFDFHTKAKHEIVIDLYVIRRNK